MTKVSTASGRSSTWTSRPRMPIRSSWEFRPPKREGAPSTWMAKASPFSGGAIVQWKKLRNSSTRTASGGGIVPSSRKRRTTV
jgi:hypothetical protein